METCNNGNSKGHRSHWAAVQSAKETLSLPIPSQLGIRTQLMTTPLLLPLPQVSMWTSSIETNVTHFWQRKNISFAVSSVWMVALVTTCITKWVLYPTVDQQRVQRPFLMTRYWLKCNLVAWCKRTLRVVLCRTTLKRICLLLNHWVYKRDCQCSKEIICFLKQYARCKWYPLINCLMQ